jgi:hypothetical protein
MCVAAVDSWEAAMANTRIWYAANMYLAAYDRAAGLLVALNDGEITPGDHALSLKTLEKLDRDGGSEAGPLVTVNVLTPNASSPTARMRQDYAVLRSKLVAPRHLFLIVTQSTPIRSVITAVNWLRPESERFVTRPFATFELAVKFAESQRGRPLPELGRLHAEVQRQRMSAPGISTSHG